MVLSNPFSERDSQFCPADAPYSVSMRMKRQMSGRLAGYFWLFETVAFYYHKEVCNPHRRFEERGANYGSAQQVF